VPFRLREFNPNVRFHEVEVNSYPLFKYPPYTLGLAAKIAQVASEEAIDVIHAHYAVPHAVSAFLAKQILGGTTPKIVTTLHGTDITLVGADESFYRVTKFAIEVSDAVTAVSRYLRERTLEDFELSKSIEVIYNFVDTTKGPRGRPSDRNHWAPLGEKILVHASNFRPVKRVTDVVRIFDLVRRQVNSKLLLVGEGPEKMAARELVRELRLADHVHFLGEQDYIENILEVSDLLLLPSEQESFGLVALEAMSCGVPVVGSRVGGLPEVVLHGQTGYLLPVGDIRDMAEASVRLLASPEEHGRMSENARKRARDHFEASDIIPQYERLYESIL
jgi:N-acetyl-alpha-D-glucosaminyl L-malate synthase BshA